MFQGECQKLMFRQHRDRCSLKIGLGERERALNARARYRLDLGGNLPVHVCHDMTKPPRMLVGAISAEKIGTVTSLSPMPIPRRIRQPISSSQLWVNAWPMGASKEKIAAMKMTCRRPSRWFRGSQIQPALIDISTIAKSKVAERTRGK